MQGVIRVIGSAPDMNEGNDYTRLEIYAPAPECAHETGRQIAEVIRADRKLLRILTRQALLSAIRGKAVLGRSTNAKAPPQVKTP